MSFQGMDNLSFMFITYQNKYAKAKRLGKNVETRIVKTLWNTY